MTRQAGACPFISNVRHLQKENHVKIRKDGQVVVTFRMKDGIPTHYGAQELSPSLRNLLIQLASHGFAFRRSKQAGKTINVVRDEQRFGYINGSVIQKGGVLGYHFAPLGNPTNSCPPQLIPKLIPFFCQRYSCTQDDLVLHEGKGNNSGNTYLVIKSPVVALRALLQDAGMAEPSEYEEAAELQRKFEVAVNRSRLGSSEERQRQLRQAPKHPKKIRAMVDVFDRNPDVVAEVLELAAGICGGCKRDAPFNRKKDGQPYLEVHHRVWLSLGGEDTVENAIALCPNCHRKSHYGENA